MMPLLRRGKDTSGLPSGGAYGADVPKTPIKPLISSANRITISDIAAAAGVSHQVVSVSLRGAAGGGSVRVSTATAERVRRLAAELGYRPNSAARSMRAGRHHRIALLTSTRDGTNAVPQGFIERLHDRLADAGLELTLHRVDDAQLVDGQRLPVILSRWSCDGLVVTYTCDLPPRLEELIGASGLPAVWVNRRRTSNCVLFADEAAAAEATRQLAALGHRRIAFVCAERDETTHHSIAERRTGYRQAMRDLGLTPLEVAAGECRWLRTAKRPTGVVCYSDRECCSVAGACLRLGLRIPGDCSLTGILTYGPHLDLDLAHGELDGLALGAAAAAMMRQLLQPGAAPQPPVVIPVPFKPGASIAQLEPRR